MARKGAKEPNGESHTPQPAAQPLDSDQRQALHFRHVQEYEAVLAAKKTADANLKNVAKRIKSEGGAVEDINLTIQLRTEEGEAKFKAKIERQAEVARWNGLPMGAQGDMFDEGREPAADRAFADGKRAGLKGDVKKPPHDPSTEQYRKWMDGYNEGQKVVVETHIKSGPLPSMGDAPATHQMM